MQLHAHCRQQHSGVSDISQLRTEWLSLVVQNPQLQHAPSQDWHHARVLEEMQPFLSPAAPETAVRAAVPVVAESAEQAAAVAVVFAKTPPPERPPPPPLPPKRAAPLKPPPPKPGGAPKPVPATLTVVADGRSGAAVASDTATAAAGPALIREPSRFRVLHWIKAPAQVLTLLRFDLLHACTTLRG